MKIQTLPVYSKLAEDTNVPLEIAEKLPSGWRLYHHQLATYEALLDSQCEVIFNTALTGDGKSLAGQLPVLIKGGSTEGMMAMYPTNELIRDQRSQLAHAVDLWQTNLYFDMLNSAVLDEIMAEGIYSQRGDALIDTLQNSDIVLTNPDIFHLIMHQFYTRRGDAPDKVFGPLIQRFTQFTFDEFHIFDTPQVISVLNAMLLVYETESLSRPHKFLFLSATPGEVMARYLDRSGLSVCEITGDYAHSDAGLDADQWRQILRGATIHIEAGGVEAWVEAHLEDTLLSFFNDRGPQAKGAIIVNSVATAYRLLHRLAPVFRAYGLTVAPNTGITSRTRRAASYEADLLIGTSTVDVGVDFQINFLLFESRDAGSFLQRLGRLGRHEGYVRDGHTYAFEDFVAYALVPDWIQETLFKGQDGDAPLLEADAVMDRETLNRAIEKAYPPTATFDRYARQWGKLQSVHILRGLSNPTIKDQYTPVRAALGQRYEETFDIHIRSAFGRYKDLYKEKRRLWDEVISFRGGSYFMCNIIDETEEGGDKFKVVDLFQMVANARLGALEEEVFYAGVARMELSKRPFEFHDPLAFFRMFGWREERQNYGLILDHDISHWSAERFDQATLLTGWRLDANVPNLNGLNRRLSRRKLPALLCRGDHPLEIKRRLRLPLLFALYTFISRDGVEGCVAFGREALLLDTRLSYRAFGKKETGAMFC